MFRQNHVFQFVPTASCPTTEKPHLCHLCTPLLLFPHLSKPSLFWAGQSQLSQERFSSPSTIQWHFAGLCPQPHISLALGSPTVSTAPQCTPAGQELQLAQPAPSSALGALAARAHSWLTAVPLAPRAFPEGWYPSNLKLMLLLLPASKFFNSK